MQSLLMYRDKYTKVYKRTSSFQSKKNIISTRSLVLAPFTLFASLGFTFYLLLLYFPSILFSYISLLFYLVSYETVSNENGL